MAVITKKFNVELVLLLGEIPVSRVLYEAATSCVSSPDTVAQMLTVDQIVAGNANTLELITNVRRIGVPDLNEDLPVNTVSELAHISATKIKLDLTSGQLVFDIEFDAETGIFDFNRTSYDDLPFTALEFTTQEIEDYILHVRNVFGI